MFGKSKGHSAIFLRAVVVILGFACVAFPAKAEIVHLNTLVLNQTRSTDIATQYERQFNVLSDSRITSILLQPSETQTSSLFAFPSMTVSINGSEFRYVSRDETTRVLTLTGDVTLSAGDVATITMRGGSIFGPVYISETGLNLLSAFWVTDASGHYPRLSLIENERPVIDMVDDVSSIENRSETIALNAQDPENDAVTWSATGLPTGASLNTANGMITGAPTVPGTYEVDVQVVDVTGGTDTETFTWTVAPNNAPVFNPSLSNQSARERLPASHSISASDADGDSVTLSASGLPAGISFDAASGVFSGSPTTPGTYSVTVIADDGFGGRTSGSFDWVVTANNVPTITPITDQETRVNVAANLAISGADADSDWLAWTATGLPSGLTINGTSGRISGTPVLVGDFTPTVTATDIVGDSVSAEFSWSITANNAPVIVPVNDQTTRENIAVNLAPSASDEDGDSFTWAAENLPVGLDIDADSGAISGTPTFAGTFNPTLTVTDSFGATATAEFNWMVAVNNAPLLGLFGSQSGRVNIAVNIPLSASDTDGDTLTWSATGLPSGVTLDTATGIISGAPTVAGSFSPQITVSDGFGGTDMAGFSWIVAANDVPVLAAIDSFSSRINDAYGIMPNAFDANGDTLSWTASGLPAGISIDASSGQVSGAPTALGDHNVTITVNDNNDGTASRSFVWTVVANTVPVITAIDNQDTKVDVPFSFTPTVTDDDDANFAWTASGLPTGVTIDATSGAISGTPTAVGDYSVTLTVSDNSGGTTDASFAWAVRANQAPAITAIDNQEATVDVAVSFTPTFTDADDTDFAWSASGLPDGLSIDATSGAITGTPTTTGTFNVALTVTDASGASDSASFDWVIVTIVAQDAPATQDNPDAAPSGSEGDPVATEDEEVQMVEMEQQARIHYAVLQDHSVINAIESVRQSLVPALNPVMESGFSRLGELLEQAGEAPTNRSSLGLKFAFADQAVQQISDVGTAQALGDAVSDEVDGWLPDGWAVWSRGEVSVGKLKAARTGDKIDIDGNHFAFGADKRLNEKLTLGGFLQSGTAKAQINGASETKAVSAVFYGSYVLSDTHYLQAALGQSKLDIDMQRISAGTEHSGSRDGDSTHLLLSAARRLLGDFADIVITIEAGSQMTDLAAYAEKDGPNAYHYMAQQVRHDHIGLRARLDETYDLDFGDLKLTGEFGYQADLSNSSKAQAYQLNDESLIYTHDVSNKDDAYSSSHSMVRVGADLTGDNGWTYSAKGYLRHYETGNIAGLSLQAAYRF